MSMELENAPVDSSSPVVSRLQENVDTQTWVSRECFHLLGQSVVVRSTSPEFAAQVRRFLRSFPMDSGDGLSPHLTISIIVAPPSKSRIQPVYFIYRDYSPVGCANSYWHLFRLLECQLNLFLGEAVTDRYLLHAGAVAIQGAGIILAGPPDSGKTSLTMALLLKGYSYLSDELAVVDPITRELHPYPKPLSIRDPSLFPELDWRRCLYPEPEAGEPGAVWYIHPEDFTATPISEPVPVRYVIFPKYDPTAAPHLQQLSKGRAAWQLMENSLNICRLGKDGLRLLAELVEGAQCFSLIANDLETRTALITELTTR